MIPRFAITVHRATPTGQVVADLTRVATACSWSFNLHGAASLDVTAPRRFVEAMRLYQMTGLLWVVVSQGGRRVWVGRLSAPELWSGEGGSGVTLRALGRWAALGDVPYTALWSDTSVEGWEPTRPELIAARLPDRYEIDFNNRIYIAPKKGEAFAPVNQIGSVYYSAPHQGARSIQAFSCDYSITLPANWVFAINSMDNFGGAATQYGPLVATGLPQTGTISITYGGSSQLEIYCYNNTGGVYTVTANTGDWHVRLTNLRVKTTTAASVTADLVAADLVSHINTVNPGILSSSTLLQSPGYDLTDLVFEDADPRDVLNLVTEKGDGAGTVYDVGVDIDGQLSLRPRGTNARKWLVDVGDIQVTSERDSLVNSVYAVYEDAEGRVLRTAVSADAAGVGLAGYTRRAAVSVRTTSSARAEGWRDQALADGKTVRPSGRYGIARIRTAYGALADPSEVRPGDTLTIRNLPLAAGAGGEVDRVRTFRISETEYDPLAEQPLTVTPETPQPRLEVLIAQGAI